MNRILCCVLLGASTLVLSENLGCRAAGVGDPCVPEREYDPSFAGFRESEVSVESKSFQCQTRTCLVNHFRGRVSCSHGQGPQREADAPCTVPGTDQPIAPSRPDPLGDCVPAQCTDRTADDAVYCSCRCGNLEGRTDDGALYCECPEAFECSDLVGTIGEREQGLTGRYCVKKGTAFRRENNCASTLAGDLGNCVQ